MKRRTPAAACRRCRRTGAAALDYALLLGVILPLAGTVFYFCPRIIKLVFDMTAMLISWPFM